MTKFKWLAPIVVLGLLLTGCNSGHNSSTSASKSASSSKTVIASKKYTTQQLQARYNKITDAVIKPLSMASYSDSSKNIIKQINVGKGQLQDISLQLQDNTSNPTLNKALINYIKISETMLTQMTGTDKNAYKQTTTEFNKQASSIARTYFNGAFPQSMVTYSQRMSAASSSSASSSSK